MLTEICQYLKNWFDKGLPKYCGEFAISNNEITKDATTLDFLDGQYVRIVGSILNDGVHKFPFSDLRDEIFSGSVWSMAVPEAVVDLAADIETWQAKYGGADSLAVSPFKSESFGGYSYTKGSSSSSQTEVDIASWQDAFRSRLMIWKKLPY